MSIPKTNQLKCLQCGAEFKPTDGTAMGKHILCSQRCADAIYQIVQRDYPTMRQEEAISRIVAERASSD